MQEMPALVARAWERGHGSRDIRMKLPNFLIIGAAKSGTTALFHYLGQHPEIFMSRIKETHFFCHRERNKLSRGPGDRRRATGAISSLRDYSDLFAGATTEKALGESCPSYLASPGTAETIRTIVPEAKIIAILRNPADRAYSAFMHMRRDGHEGLTRFEDALAAEEERIRKHWSHIWHYRTNGFYHAQIRPYFERFERERIRVYLYEEFAQDAQATVKDIFGFLGVDPSFVPDTSFRPNRSGIPRSRTMHRFLTRPHPVKTLFKPLFSDLTRLKIVSALRSRNLVREGMGRHTRRRLLEEFEPDIRDLERLLGRDLSRWFADTGLRETAVSAPP